MEYLEFIRVTPVQVLNLINSSWFLLYALPIFLPLESGITYFYLKKVKTYKSIAEKKNILTTHWAYLVIKLFLAWSFYNVALTDMDRPGPYRDMGWFMILYYLYSLGVCAAFVAYLYNRYAPGSFAKRILNQPDTPPEIHLAGAVIADPSENFQGMLDRAPDCAGRSVGGMVISVILLNCLLFAGVIFLVCGGLDDYFGVNGTADYHELGKEFDKIDLVLRGLKNVYIAVLIGIGVVTTAVVFFRERRSTASPPEAGPDAPASGQPDGRREPEA